MIVDIFRWWLVWCCDCDGFECLFAGSVLSYAVCYSVSMLFPFFLVLFLLVYLLVLLGSLFLPGLWRLLTQPIRCLLILPQQLQDLRLGDLRRGALQAIAAAAREDLPRLLEALQSRAVPLRGGQGGGGFLHGFWRLCVCFFCGFPGFGGFLRFVLCFGSSGWLGSLGAGGAFWVEKRSWVFD